jgi:hypothetical protein
MKTQALPDICDGLAEAAADLVSGGVVYFNWKMELSSLLLAAKKEIESLRAADAEKPIVTRQGLIDYLEALSEAASEARRRLPSVFNGGSDIRDVAATVARLAAARTSLTAEQTATFSEALRQTAEACAYSYDIAFGFEVWTKTEIKKIRAYEGRNEGDAMCRLEPPGTPLPAPDLRDMDHFHRNIASGRLGEIFDRLGKIGMQKAPKCKEDDS